MQSTTNKPIFAFAILLTASVVLAADWPQWRGIDRTAVSRETDLLSAWPKMGPALVWRIEHLGEGYSSPSIAAGRIFAMGNREKDEYVLGLAEKDGKELWATRVGEVRHEGAGYPGPRSSPTVDGERLYALGINGDLVCLECTTGKVLWRKDLEKDFRGSVGPWGYSESPLIDGDRVLCTPGGGYATLAALNKMTGELIWRGVVPQGDPAAYSSIITAQVDGQKQYIQFLSRGVVGLSAEGKFLWRYDRPANGTANCTTPVFHDGAVFAASGYGTGGGLARIVKEEDRFKAEEVYFTRKMRNHHGGIVLVDGYLYGSDEQYLTCLEFKTGKVMWAERKAGKGSIAYADGRLYYRSEDGPIVLVEASPRGYVEHGRFTPDQTTDHPAWPHPVIANGRLYIRDQGLLGCYELKQR